jgi:outer membrane protein assembly factor BamA
VTTSYIHSIDLDNSDASNYLKWLFSMKGFVNARGRIVLANFVRFGGAYSIEGNPLPEVERFRLGGAKGVRGFEDGEIAQYNKDGSLRDGDPTTPEVERIDGGDYTLSGTSELRFPFMVELGPLELWGATFFDWGGLAEEITDFHERSFRASGGLGIRLLLYGRVPIRLDYGVKVSPRCKVFAEDQETCIEKESPGELDFNLLYTF